MLQTHPKRSVLTLESHHKLTLAVSSNSYTKAGTLEMEGLPSLVAHSPGYDGTGQPILTQDKCESSSLLLALLTICCDLSPFRTIGDRVDYDGLLVLEPRQSKATRGGLYIGRQ